MPFRRPSKLLLCLVALFFTAGHAHQVLGRFIVHHHHGIEIHVGELGRGEGGEHHHEHDGETDPDMQHMLQHFAEIAESASARCSVATAMIGSELPPAAAVRVPQARPAQIEHPPKA